MSLADLIINRAPLPSYLVRYENGRTPFSTWTPVLLVLTSYLAIIFGVQEVMRPRKPLKLTVLFQLHNLFLTSGSFVLLALMVEEMAPIVHSRGLLYSICNKSAWTPKLEFYFIINYYLKYIELVDTLFLVLKKKPLTFLHIFHHSATALLCYATLNSKPSVIWIPITLNLTVHVVMYYYYYATASGRKMWWKKYLTSFQITQFVIDLVVLCVAAYAYFTFTYFPRFASLGSCSTGTEIGTSIFGCSLIASYLLLFLSFYRNTYKKAHIGNGNLNGCAVLTPNDKAE